MSETSDVAVTIDLDNLVGLDTREGMNALTDFGDAAVLLPLSVVILLWMIVHHGRGVSASWVIAVSLCVGATTLLKIYLYACPPQPNLVSPSGHTSLSVLIYGAIALVIATEQRRWSRAVIFFSGTGLIVAIVGSRLWLNAHTAPEVVIGIVIGVATLTLFADRYGRSRTEGVSLSPFILRQALSLGAHVRKGEKGTTVVYADRFVPYRERTPPKPATNRKRFRSSSASPAELRFQLS
jgi:membrane-associated phospholipid phosphatase